MNAAALSKKLAVAVMTVAVGVGSATGSDRVVVELVEREIEGRVLSIDSRGVRLETGEGTLILAIDDVIRVVRPPTPAPSSEAALGLATLRDGSVLPHNHWRIRGARVLFELGRLAHEVPLSEIASWRLPSTAPGRDEAWRLVQTAPASDVLVVVTRGGSLRPILGVIDSIDSGSVRFLLDDEPIDVGMDRVAGFMFYRERGLPAGGPVLRGPHGWKVVARSLTLEDGLVGYETGYGTQAEVSLDDLQELDYSREKVWRVGDLEVIEAEWKPFFGRVVVPGAGFDGYGDRGGLPRRNASYYGDPLALRMPDPRDERLRITRPFDSGWALRSRSELTLGLPGPMRWLRGWVGLAPGMEETGSAEARVLADGRSIWSAVIDGRTPPVELRLPLQGAERLTLAVDYGENLDTGDILHFAELRVVR